MKDQHSELSSTAIRKAKPPSAYWRPRRWRYRVLPAFWTIASGLSLLVNVILIVVVILLSNQLFLIKKMVGEQLLGGLYQNFVLMDNARIQTMIPVETSVPAKFDLPLDTNTIVVLNEDTFVQGARVSLATGGLSIQSAPTDILLPKGTQLPIHLNLTVPVRQSIPVKLNVAVDIPLNQTDLHEPFVGLQQVVQPYYALVDQIPGSWGEILCNSNNHLCQSFIGQK